MASVKLEHIYKVYTGGVKAVSDMTLDIKDGEFIVFSDLPDVVNQPHFV